MDASRTSVVVAVPPPHNPIEGVLVRVVRSFVVVAALLVSGAIASGAAPASQPPARQDLAPLAEAAPGAGVPGIYIVTVRDGVDAPGLARRQELDPTRIYDAALNGFAAPLTPAQLDRVRRSQRRRASP